MATEKFETSLKKLEEIVRRLESGSLSLVSSSSLSNCVNRMMPKAPRNKRKFAMTPKSIFKPVTKLTGPISSENMIKLRLRCRWAQIGVPGGVCGPGGGAGLVEPPGSDVHAPASGD